MTRRRASSGSLHLAALIVLAGAIAAACSSPPVYVPNESRVVVATENRGSTVHVAFGDGTSRDIAVSKFLSGLGSGNRWLMLAGSSPSSWVIQVFPSARSYTEPGCFEVNAAVADAGRMAEISMQTDNGGRIVLRLPKAATFVNHYNPGLASTATGTLACINEHGEVMSTH